MSETGNNQQNTVVQEGYYTGVLDIYYAKMTGADSLSAAPTYGTPAVLAKTIDVAITPNYKTGSAYASNVTTRSEKRIDTYTVTLNMDKIPRAVQKDLFGRKEDSNGVQVVEGGAIAPYVAILFAVTLDDGNKELWALYKGKFSEPDKKAHTESDQIQYQFPTIEATFVRREYDNLLASVADTANEDLGSGVASGWFTSVYEPTYSSGGGGGSGEED